MAAGDLTTASALVLEEAAARGPALPPVRPFAVMMASVRRDWGTARSYKFPLVLTGVQLIASTGSFFFLGHLVGHGVTSSIKSQLHQGYFAFIMIGNASLSIVATTLTTFARRLRQDQTTGTLEALLISPSPAWLVIPASASYELVFAATTSVVTVGLAAAIFGLRFDVALTSGAAALLAFVGALLLFCAIGIAFSGFILVFKRGDTGITLVTTAFSLLCGVLYPIQLLPTPMRLIAEIVPFTWVLEVLRAGLLDRSAEWLRLGELWLVSAGLIPCSLWIFDRALHHARRDGTLAQY